MSEKMESKWVKPELIRLEDDAADGKSNVKASESGGGKGQGPS